MVNGGNVFNMTEKELPECLHLHQGISVLDYQQQTTQP
jgi:hypothetical protein